MASKQEITIGSDSRLFFSDDIVIKATNGERYLCVSVKTANWIVVDSIAQVNMLRELINGKTIQEVIDTFFEDDLHLFYNLLSRLMARRFASMHPNGIEIQTEDNSKSINIYLTQACNMRCKHCFMRSGSKLERELSKEQWIKVLDDFKVLGGENVTFTGGEPLMNPCFEEIVKHASGIGLKVTVLSNGVLWADSLIDSLYEHIDQIQISLDGVDELSNAAVRGKGYFETVKNNILKMANKGYRISVATTFTLENLNDDTKLQYAELVEDLKRNSKTPIFFKVTKKMLNGRSTEYSAEEARNYYNKVIEIERFVDENSREGNFMAGHEPNFVDANCGFGGMSISADGSVYYCNRISEVDSYGNVTDKPLAYFHEIGKVLKAKTDVDHVKPCCNCYLRYICGGGCRIDDFNFKGQTINYNGELMRMEPMESCMAKMEQRMIEGFDFKFVFNS